MSPHVRLLRSPGGELVAAKSAWPPDDESRLVREAAVLVAARHPGVVPLCGLRARGGALELHTRWVGPRSLADVAPLPADQAAAVLGAVAATVADLHRHGVSHGSLEPSHVLLDGRGRPVLCSFGRARLVAGPDLDARAADVAALGDLLEAVIGLPDDPEIVPARRFGRRRAHHLHRHLLTVADHARADDVAARPTAARLAAALVELAPDAGFPVTSGDGASSMDAGAPVVDTGDLGLTSDLERLRASATTVDRRHRRRWPFGLAALGILASISGAAALAAGTGTGGASFDAVEPRPSPPPTLIDHPTTARPTGSPPPVVQLDGRRFEVGRAGDRAVVGPWRCDGRPRALLVRPGTGELFLFDEAAPPDADSTVAAFARDTGMVELVAPASDDPCPQAAGIDAQGRVRPITIPAGHS